MKQKTGTLVSLSIVAAIVSFILTFTGNPIWALFAAIISVPLGIGGFIRAASPRVGSGVLSIFAVILGVFAAGFAVLGVVGVILF